MTRAGLSVQREGIDNLDRSTWPQCPAGSFWIPGEHLDTDYPTPTADELRQIWQDHMNVSEAISTNDVFGVFTPPEREIYAIASVDLCEVVRHTKRGLHAATDVRGNHSAAYSEGTWYDVGKVGYTYERSIVESVTRVLMNNRKIEPVKGIKRIANILRTWRENGVWVTANTSTLPGCERPTIEYNLAEDCDGQFDGLILPRGHDGNGTISKATALKTALKEVGLDSTLPIIHLDDADVHHKGFRDARDEFGKHLYLLAPDYGHEVPNADIVFPTPLETFLGAHALFKELGVVR